MATLPAARIPRAIPRQMSKSDICNVELLTRDDADAVGIPLVPVELDDATGDFWTLSTEGPACRYDSPPRSGTASRRCCRLAPTGKPS